MNFIRNNRFLVICVAVALVAIGGLVFWNMGIEEDVEGVVAQRDDLARKVEKLSRKPYANKKTIEAEEKKNSRLLEQFAKVRQKNDEFNSATFSKILVTLPDGGTIPALPYDDQLWKSKSLGYRYIEAYYKALDELLMSMVPTRPGTEKDVEEKAVGIQERMETERLIDERRKRAAAGGTDNRPAAGVARGGPGLPEEIPGMGGPDIRGTARTLSEAAKKEAFDVIRVQQAGRGVVFATADVFEVMFPRGVLVSSVTPQQVYDSWVSYNIQAAVVHAINATNEQAFAARNVSEGNRNVTTAAIKRLYGIQVQQREVRKAPAYEAGPRPGVPVSPMGVAEPAVNTLTGAKTDEIGNVVRYTFSVLMRTADLPLLEKNLIGPNYHVILNEDITSSFETGLMSFARADIGGGRGAVAGEQTKDEAYYYYGTEPVRVVTLQAEVRLLSGWLRGTWNQEDSKWETEPLMPIEVLKELPASALRPIDRKRIDGTLGQTAPAGMPTVRGRGPR